jgi:hypothetical protein
LYFDFVIPKDAFPRDRGRRADRLRQSTEQRFNYN